MDTRLVELDVQHRAAFACPRGTDIPSHTSLKCKWRARGNNGRAPKDRAPKDRAPKDRAPKDRAPKQATNNLVVDHTGGARFTVACPSALSQDPGRLFLLLIANMTQSTIVGAPLSEVWDQAIVKEAARSSKNRPKHAARPSKSKRKAAAADPLCELYQKGYSASVEDAIEAYSSGDAFAVEPCKSGVKVSPARAAPGSECRWTASFSGGLMGNDGNDDNGASVAGFSDSTACGAPFDTSDATKIDFYNDESSSDEEGDVVVRPANLAQLPRPPPDLAPAPSPAPAPAPAAVQDSAAASPGVTFTKTSYDLPVTSTYVLEIILFTLSGILLILALEQFIQLGVRMRIAPALSPPFP
jgi:hypothetical protein